MTRSGKFSFLCALVGLASLGADCDEPEVKVTGDPDAGTGIFTNPTYGYSQSETAISTNTVGSSTVVTVAFNDDTQSPMQQSKIVYTESTRTVYSGASLMGWSYSQDKGSTWTYGGRLTPPAGWAVLWGDPSITNVPSDQSKVFMTNLAVPNSKYPAGGIVGTMSSAYMGGACIAKSVDAGRSFSMYQCINNQNHFYDGASMAAGVSGVYAAFKDFDSGRVDVWRAPDPNSAFVRLPDPFPWTDMWAPVKHPRLRFASNMLWAATLAMNGQVLINRYICLFGACSWQTPVVVSEPGTWDVEVPLEGGQTLRTGSQFSFDVGTGTDDNSVRVVITRTDPVSGRFYVKGSICANNLSACYAIDPWSSLSGSGHQFNPLVKAATRSTGETVFMVSFNSVNDGIAQGNNIQSVQARLTGTWSNGPLDYVVSGKIPPHPVCPDDRGYRGDYDDLQFLDRNASGAPRFIRAYSDSTNGCQYQWEFTSKHLHVSSAIVE